MFYKFESFVHEHECDCDSRTLQRVYRNLGSSPISESGKARQSECTSQIGSPGGAVSEHSVHSVACILDG